MFPYYNHISQQENPPVMHFSKLSGQHCVKAVGKSQKFSKAGKTMSLSRSAH